jgi:hypothetical protein
MSSQATTQSNAQDQRVVLETTAGGQFVGPGATVANPYGIATSIGPVGSRSRVETSFAGAMFGLQGAEVQGLVDSVLAQNQQQHQSVIGLGQSLASGLKDQATQLGGIVEAAKTPDKSTLSTLLPLAIVGVIFFFLVK